jgi:hypothetical protein
MKSSIFAAALLVCLPTLPAVAQTDLYDNGPINGEQDAWTVSSGFAVSDSFALGSAATVNEVQFESFMFPGDVLESAEVSITSHEFGGTTFFDQNVNFAASNCFNNDFGFNVCTQTGTFNGLQLSAGTYWLSLSNAVINNGDPVYWDENSGPSLASENTIGTIPSESFTILGTASSGTGSTPEPSALVLFASGIVGLAGLLRRRRQSEARNFPSI